MSLQLRGQNQTENGETIITGSGKRDGPCRDLRWSHRGYHGVCRLWPPLCDLLTRWRHDAFRFDPEPVEVQTGAMAIALSVWLCFLPHQVAGRPSNFSLMVLNLWPAFVWVLLFLLVGVAQIVALKRRWLGARCACAMVGLWLWLFVAVLLTLEGLSGPSVAIFPVIALSEAWVYLRLRAHSDIPPCLTSTEARPESASTPQSLIHLIDETRDPTGDSHNSTDDCTSVQRM